MGVKRVVVIGAGMGGLSAASYLARAGVEVTVVEAAPFVGGLAAGFEVDGLAFDGGPYILLDKPGLSWAFEALGLSLDGLALRRIDEVYEVRSPGEKPVRVQGDLEATAEGMERDYAGAGTKYRRFVAEMKTAHQRLMPLLTHEHPGPWSALVTGAFRAAPVLLRSLEGVLRRSGLPSPVIQALGIWTHIAGQELKDAPSPLAFVPALIHSEGCYVPEAGIAAIPRALAAHARESGVQLRLGTAVERILVERDRAVGVRLSSGEELRADAVVSNAGGVGTLLELVPGGSDLDAYVRTLPLQSPGVAAYVTLERPPRAPYMHFWLTPDDAQAPSRLLVCPRARSAPFPARIVAPLAHAVSSSLGEAGQEALLERIVQEPRWREEFGEFDVVMRRTPRIFGAIHRLYADSMNPVMTAAFMRRGRLPHRLPKPAGLYLVGSATHPGQWVSFCAISGVLGARKVLRDFG